MALNVWTQNSGYSLGTFQERKKLEIFLPVANDAGTTYTVISGELPGGIAIVDNKLIGIPFEVSRATTYVFCIRARNSSAFSDRTLNITIEGADAPVFITDPGFLSLDNKQLYVLDSTFVDYQLEVIDQDTSVGQKLSYFIARNDGQLPPGLVLTEDGRITGFIEPAISIRPEDGDGTYDNSYYDAVAFDFSMKPSNGYDSYNYSSVTYGYNVANNLPKKLNRNYEFTVTVTDGDSIVKRTFKLFVVGDDYFRADNTDTANPFTADITYLRSPIWITSSDLGTFRANNYITLVIDTYDRENIIYSFEQVNSDISARTLNFLSTDNLAGNDSITIDNASGVPVVGQYFTFQDRLIINDSISSQIFLIGGVIDLGNNCYRLSMVDPVSGDPVLLSVNVPNNLEFFIGSLSTLPPGLSFDIGTAEVYGSVPYQPAITQTYNFTITATRISDREEKIRSSRKFTVRIIGEIDSVINWNTNSDLGTINANFTSTLSINATSTVPDAVVLYKIVSGQLPPGLNLSLDGEITGKTNQFGEGVISGLTRFYDEIVPSLPKTFTTFESGTTIDRVFTFTAEARDQFGYSATTRTFTVKVDTPNEKLYSNIKVKPFLNNMPTFSSASQREQWTSFINDATIFTPSNIYRPNDSNFGVQRDLSMVVYAGIETKDAAAYISAIGLNHKRKRFKFGDLKTAVATVPGTRTSVYEIIYIEMLDPLEPNGKRLGNKLENLGLHKSVTVDSSNVLWRPGFTPKTDAAKRAELSVSAPDSPRPEPIITIDSTGYLVSSPKGGTYFPSSISNWRDRLRTVGETERNYLPLWMRSIQPGSREELGFTLAVPLCYCKVGTSIDVLNNIKNAIKTGRFDFKLLDYTADRYIIDSVEGQASDKYLVFKNDRITV